MTPLPQRHVTQSLQPLQFVHGNIRRAKKGVMRGTISRRDTPGALT